MKKLIPLAIAFFVSIFALSLVVPSEAQAQPRGSRNSSRGSTNGNETYLVVKITDPNRPEHKVDYRVVNTSQFKDEERRLKDDYNKAIVEWKDLKKTEPTAPMPVKATIKKIGTPYHSQKIAQDYATKLMTEEDNKDNQTTSGSTAK